METKQRSFFGSSGMYWRFDNDIRAIIKFFEKEKQPYNLWMLPFDADSEEAKEFEIEYYTPQVEGRVYLGRCDFNK
jgi:hypothetical protein